MESSLFVSRFLILESDVESCVPLFCPLVSVACPAPLSSTHPGAQLAAQPPCTAPLVLADARPSVFIPWMVPAMLILMVLTMVQYVYFLLLILMINDDYGGARLVAATRLNL